MIKKLLAIMLSAILLTSFSGCDSINFNLSPENLMTAPKLTTEQEEIDKALREYAGNVTIKYPKTGTYRSAFIMKDLDGDGANEAIVFYSIDADTTSEYLRINILDNEGYGWHSVCNFAGHGFEVDEVSFANMDNPNRINIVVGWNVANQDDKEVLVYEYHDKTLDVKYQSPYTIMELMDIDNDNLDDLLLINSSYNTYLPKMSLVSQKYVSNIDLVSEVTLKGPIVEYKSIKTGFINSVDKGIFVDVLRGQNTYFTEVISYENENLINKTYSAEEDYSFETYRDYNRLCEDINGDEIIEIPSVYFLPQYTENYSEQLFLTAWKQIINSNFVTVRSTFDDDKYNFSFTFPDEWVGNVTAVRLPEIKEVVFYQYNLTNSYNKPILHIKLFSEGDLKDEYETDGYKYAGKNTKFEYYYKIADTSNIPYHLLISEEKFLNNFSIQNQLFN